jgi:hypothetical protein
MKLHNAHLLIPEKLWNLAKREAKKERKTITAIVCEALMEKLEKGKNGKSAL